MIGRVFRMLASWCWAMYLVLLIAWVVALVTSFGIEIHGTMEVDGRNTWLLREGLLEASLTQSLNRYGSTLTLLPLDGVEPRTIDITLPGFQYTREFRRTMSFDGSIFAWSSLKLRMTGGLITGVTLLPLILALVIHLCRRRLRSENDLHHGLGAMAGVLFRLATGVALWLMAGLVVITLAAPNGRNPAISLDMGMPSSAFAIFRAELDDSLVLSYVADWDDERAEYQGIMRLMGRPSAFAVEPAIELPLWVAYVSLAILPLISLIVAIRRVPFAAGCCRACGYDLRGSPAGNEAGAVKCPECGWSRAEVAKANG